MRKNIKELLSFKNFIFDLDNTLYNENIYLFSAYEQIGIMVSKEYGIDKKIVYKYLTEEFLSSGRGMLFSRMVNKFNLNLSDLDSFLVLLRSHQLEKKIKLYDKMQRFLKEINGITSDMFIVTNGNVEQQKNKISQIHWNDFLFKEIVFANEYKPKPSNEALEYLIDKYQLDRQRSIFIGDAKSDELCAISSDVAFYHVNNILKVY